MPQLLGLGVYVLSCVPVLCTGSGTTLAGLGVFIVVDRLSLVWVHGDFSLVVVHGLLLFQSTGSRARGLQSLRPTGLVAQHHV